MKAHRWGGATATGDADAPGGQPIFTPAPGTAVLACRWGQVLSLPDMQRCPAVAPTSGPTIEPIRCRRCAAT